MVIALFDCVAAVSIWLLTTSKEVFFHIFAAYQFGYVLYTAEKTGIIEVTKIGVVYFRGAYHRINQTGRVLR